MIPKNLVPGDMFTQETYLQNICTPTKIIWHMRKSNLLDRFLHHFQPHGQFNNLKWELEEDLCSSLHLVISTWPREMTNSCLEKTSDVLPRRVGFSFLFSKKRVQCVDSYFSIRTYLSPSYFSGDNQNYMLVDAMRIIIHAMCVMNPDGAYSQTQQRLAS